jgi:hypothetical protein
VIVSFAPIDARSKEEALDLSKHFWQVAGDGDGAVPPGVRGDGESVRYSARWGSPDERRDRKKLLDSLRTRCGAVSANPDRGSARMARQHRYTSAPAGGRQNC